VIEDKPRVSTFPAALGPDLTQALEKKGFETLTAVQAAVLDPALDGRDLRITSQTGSGKTVAIGLAIRSFVAESVAAAADRRRPGAAPAKGALAHPCAMVVAPTRELAKQVEEELSWLFGAIGARVVSVTGGASVRDERHALGGRPAVVVGTPGRLLDHLKRGAIDASGVRAICLDEADRLLDMGFRDDLDAIVAFAPEGRQMHLVSATFPREVKALADATQHAPVHVEGTRLGVANADIDHVVHLVEGRQRLDALVNLLLANPEEQTLVFARTRADVATVAHELSEAGFAAAPLSGEMDQAARNRALAAFRRGDLRILVATDVAARGIDVQDIARVVHGEPPTDVDSYTHRSGRTGRAGRKGTSSVLASPPELAKTLHLLRRAGVMHRFEPIPGADDIRKRADERTLAALSKEDEPGAPGFDERTWALAKRIAAGDPTRAIARLLTATRFAGPTEPRVVRALDPRPQHDPRDRVRPGRPVHVDRVDRQDRGVDRRPAPSPSGHGSRPAGDERSSPAPRDGVEAWVPFRVSWGRETAADPRRLLAMVCRRGQIRGSDVGHIRVDRTFSVVDVASHAAAGFARSTAAPDPREPGITIRREGSPDEQPREPRPKDSHPREARGKDVHARDAHSKTAHAKDTHPKDAHPKDAHPKREAPIAIRRRPRVR
jgi:ATP-dependent RNA helicase DeaD